jgi:hypothetical protein
MGGGDQIDVVASPRLQFQHHLSQALHGDQAANVQLADRVVLAECAAPCAVAEEDGAGSGAAADGRFFPLVGRPTGDSRFNAGLTVAFLTLEAIYSALARAQRALPQHLLCPLDALSEFTVQLKL